MLSTKGTLVLLSSLVMMSLPGHASDLTGNIRIDGSSTVNPITEAVAEEFRAVAPKVRVSVGISGTGGGFKKFTVGSTDINNASRPIKTKEINKAKDNNVKYFEIPVAYDGLTVVINKNNPVDSLTIEQLHAMWTNETSAQANDWSKVGGASAAVKLFGPGPDSGTFDFFTEKVLGKSGKSRGDYSASEDDNVLVKGVSTEKNALGYFGYAYYVQNKSVLKAVAVNGIKPELSTIQSGTYPLARKIYIYVSDKAAAKPEVDKFINFYIERAGQLAADVGYIALSKEEYARTRTRYAEWKKNQSSVAGNK